MSDWQLQNAKNRLSELVDDALSRGPQTITRHGKATAVVLSVEDYRKIQSGQRPLSRFFAESPLRGHKLTLTRSRDVGRGPAAL
ncbi:MAG: type II toxin-antitoxin system Phd/YefM family antitoxin [Elusimicrobia bacterium]|nr:type II toxin-antitoxin system Phd/YefM family antitoxin [Elusimicrobiota bacterium]